MINLSCKKRIAIYKPFGIGDSLFALVISSLIKHQHPECHITYIGTAYPKELLSAHYSIDDYFVMRNEQKMTARSFKKLNLDMIIFAKSDRQAMKAAKQAKIPTRVGFGDKVYTFFYCNYFSGFFKTKKIRHNSHRLLHDYLLYQVINRKSRFNRTQIIEKITYRNHLSHADFGLYHNKFKLIIHPGAQSAQFRNWTAWQYHELIQSLDREKFQVILTGNKNEQLLCQRIKQGSSADLTDFSGQLDLRQFKRLISQCDGLVAASTGPLHLAAFMGKNTLGIYPSNHKDGSSAWGPVGKNAIAISLDKHCNSPCNRAVSQCACVAAIAVNEVKKIVLSWADNSEISLHQSTSKLWISRQDLR